MRVVIAAIGKAKAGPERTLFEEYVKRLPWKITLKEMDVKKTLPPARRMEEEAKLLLAACDGVDRLVALDERGETLSTRELAATLKRWQQEGSVGFVIGGADGLDGAVRKRADLVLSFGRLTWPHMLARAMLAEQLYRAQTVIAGHPYHRE